VRARIDIGMGLSIRIRRAVGTHRTTRIVAIPAQRSAKDAACHVVRSTLA